MPVATSVTCQLAAFILTAITPALGADDAAEITNDDVQWDGNTIGLMPKLTGRARQIARGEEDRDPLEIIRLMKDERRYAVAHVLLVELTDCLAPEGTHHWHGLTVILHGNGSVDYDADDAPRLMKQWEDFFRESKEHLSLRVP